MKRKYRANVKELADMDYTRKLKPDEREWLSQFADEYYQGAVKKDDPAAIHQTEEHRRSCFENNNTRNRCTPTKESAEELIQLAELDADDLADLAPVVRLDRIRKLRWAIETLQRELHRLMGGT